MVRAGMAWAFVKYIRDYAEQDEPEEFFAHPKNERTKTFLGQILHH